MNDSQAGANPQIPNFQVRIPLEWGNSDDVPIVYANQVMVSHAGPEFFLVFGVVMPPNAQDELPDAFVIKPQMRVVISREAMPAIVQALHDNLNRFRMNLARHQQQMQDQQQQDQSKAAGTATVTKSSPEPPAAPSGAPPAPEAKRSRKGSSAADKGDSDVEPPPQDTGSA